MSFGDFYNNLINPRVNGNVDLPQSIFRERAISSASEINSRFGSKFYLITKNEVSNNFFNHLLKHKKEKDPGLFFSLGIQEGPNGSLYVSTKNGWDLRLPRQLLPYVARNRITPFLGDIIPVTSWGSSLSNLLTKDSWNKISQHTLDEHNNMCELCGSRKKLSCHEKWRYLPPINNDIRYLNENDLLCFPDSDDAPNIGVQRLSKLMSLCQECHDINHLGMMEEDGRVEEALELISDLTRMNPREITDYYNFIKDRWEYHNNFQWVLDLSYLQSVFPGIVLDVNKNWFKFEDNPNYITNTNIGYSNEDSLPTRLLGVKWRLSYGKKAFGHDEIDSMDAIEEMTSKMVVDTPIQEDEAMFGGVGDDLGLNELLDFTTDIEQDPKVADGFDLSSFAEDLMSDDDIADEILDEEPLISHSEVFYVSPDPYYRYK